MGVELFEHAHDRAVDQLFAVHFIDVVVVDRRQDLGKDAEVRVDVLAIGQDIAEKDESREEAHDGQGGGCRIENPLPAHLRSLLVAVFDLAHSMPSQPGRSTRFSPMVHPQIGRVRPIFRGELSCPACRRELLPPGRYQYRHSIASSEVMVQRSLQSGAEFARESGAPVVELRGGTGKGLR